jgi:hypothetical protein
MLKYFLLLSFICLASLLKAQDTIVLRSGEVIAAKVTEISPREIKYKKSHMPDGPTYVQYRSDVKKIRYANGQEDIFAEEPKQASENVEQKPTISIGGQQTMRTEDNKAPSNRGSSENTDYYGGGPTYAPGSQLSARGSLYIYQQRKISERKLHEILNATGDKKIVALTGKAKDKKRLQYIGFAAIPLGVIAMATYVGATVYQPNPPGSGTKPRVKSINYGQRAVGVGIGIIGAACPVISIKAKIDRKRYNKEAVKLYNQKF